MGTKIGQVANLKALCKNPTTEREFDLPKSKLFVRTQDDGDFSLVTEVACLSDRIHVWTLRVAKRAERHESSWRKFPDHQGEIPDERMPDVFELADAEWVKHQNGVSARGRIEVLNPDDEVNYVKRAWILHDIKGLEWIDIPKEIEDKGEQSNVTLIPWSIYE